MHNLKIHQEFAHVFQIKSELEGNSNSIELILHSLSKIAVFTYLHTRLLLSHIIWYKIVRKHPTLSFRYFYAQIAYEIPPVHFRYEYNR